MKRKQKKVKGKALANQKFYQDQRSNRDLEEELQWAYEHYSEVQGQHRSECAMYGDSWPGAQHDVWRAWKAFNRLSLCLDFRSAPPTVVAQPAPIDLNEIPF